MTRLDELAGDGTMTGLVRRWIAEEGTSSPSLREAGVTQAEGSTHAACDAEIARLRSEIAALRGVTPPAFPVLTEAEKAVVGSPEDYDWEHTVKLEMRPRPDFLAAPDDDCLSCGHDRQQWHLNGRCLYRYGAPKSGGDLCGCPTFVPAAEPF